MNTFWKGDSRFEGFEDFFERVQQGKVALPKSVKGLAESVRELVCACPRECLGMVWIFPHIRRGDNVLHCRYDSFHGKLMRFWKPMPGIRSWEDSQGFVVPYE